LRNCISDRRRTTLPGNAHPRIGARVRPPLATAGPRPKPALVEGSGGRSRSRDRGTRAAGAPSRKGALKGLTSRQPFERQSRRLQRLGLVAGCRASRADPVRRPGPRRKGTGSDAALVRSYSGESGGPPAGQERHNHAISHRGCYEPAAFAPWDRFGAPRGGKRIRSSLSAQCR